MLSRAVLTVGSAWGFVFYKFGRMPKSSAMPNGHLEGEWPETPPTGWCERPMLRVLHDSIGGGLIYARCEPLEDFIEYRAMERSRTGWPMRSLAWYSLKTTPKETGTSPIIVEDRWMVSAPDSWGLRDLDAIPTRVPARPVFPGFLVNTACFIALV